MGAHGTHQCISLHHRLQHLLQICGYPCPALSGPGIQIHVWHLLHRTAAGKQIACKQSSFANKLAHSMNASTRAPLRSLASSHCEDSPTCRATTGVTPSQLGSLLHDEFLLSSSHSSWVTNYPFAPTVCCCSTACPPLPPSPPCAAFLASQGDSCISIQALFSLNASLSDLSPGIDCSSATAAIPPGTLVCVERDEAKVFWDYPCTRRYSVTEKDTCEGIRQKALVPTDGGLAPISWMDFFRLNPGLNCDNLFVPTAGVFASPAQVRSLSYCRSLEGGEQSVRVAALKLRWHA